MSAEQALQLYASAIAGRSLALARHGEPHGLSYCDSATLWIAEARAEQAWLDVALQAALVRQGSLQPSALRELLGRPARARAYLGLELARALHEQRALLPRAVLADASLQGLPPAPPSLAQSLQLARRHERPDTPAAWGCILPQRVLALQRTAATGAGAPAAEPTPQQILAQRRQADRELEESAVLDRFRNPLERSVGMLGRLLDQLLDRRGSAAMGAAAQSGGLSDAEAHEVESHGTGQRTLCATPSEPPAQPAFPGAQGFSYPEWDESRQRYRPRYVQVAEVEPHPELQRSEALLTAKSAERALRRSVAGLCQNFEPRRHQLQGDDVEVDGLVRLRTDLAGGHGGDARIYRDTRRTRRDLGVLVMLDITGSTAERGPDGACVFDRQLQAALALVQVLHGLGDRVALYGFHSWGPKVVRVPRLLAFGERPDGRLYERARRIAPSGYSRLGAAIRHGSAELQARAGTPHQLLVVLSDAFAYDQGYENDYARADTRRALAEARASQVACVCLTLGSSTDADTLKQTFGSACHLAIPHLAGQARALRRLFESAVADIPRRRYAPR